MMLFEQEHGGRVWRIEATDWNGAPRLQIWPLYHDKGSGEWRYCAARYGGGFAIPMDRLPELLTALGSVAPVDS